MQTRPTTGLGARTSPARTARLALIFAGAWAMVAASSPTRASEASPSEPGTADTIGEHYVLLPRGANTGAGDEPGNGEPGPLRGPSVCTLPVGKCQPFDTGIIADERVFSASDLGSRSADSFVAGSASATLLCWWGAHQVNAKPGAAPANETFTIRYYQNNAGLPGALVGSPIVVTPSVSATGFSHNGYNVIEYSAPHAAVPLNVGACYWVEIRQNQHSGQNAFLWWASDSGNGHAVHDLDDSTPYANYDELDALDLAFCSDAAASALAPCGSPATTTPVCGLDPFTQCQNIDDPAQSQGYYCNLNTQTIADDVHVSSSIKLTQLCWKGTYAVEPPATGDNFSITIYSNDNGKPGSRLREYFDGFYTLTRGYDGHQFDYTATIDFDTITLLGGECYWIEITNNIIDNQGNPQWAWLTTTPGSGRAAIDGGVAQLNGYNLSDTLDANMALCVSGTLSPTPACMPPTGVPGNDLCSNATVITLGQTLANQTNINAGPGGGQGVISPVTEPPCGYTLDNRATVWYRYTNIGPAQSVVASTCAFNTDFDSVVDVYCPLDQLNACGSLACVATNDINPACGESTHAAVTWFAQAGETYWLRVHGKDGNVGIFDLSLSAGGSATPMACEACDVTVHAGDVLETEPCGQNTNSTCAGAGVQTLSPGQVFFGTSLVSQGMRSGDVIRFGPFPNTPALFTASFEAEHPALVQVLVTLTPNTCDLDLYDDGYQFEYQPCEQMTITPGASLTLNPSVGYVYVRILPATDLPGGVEDFYGMPCGSNINDYRVSLSTSATGACCIGDTCSTGMTLAQCAVAGGSYKGDNTPCDGDTCAAGCQADFNHVNGVTVQDIFDFLTAWLAGNSSADFNHVNGVTVQDIFDFLTAWLAGC